MKIIRIFALALTLASTHNVFAQVIDVSEHGISPSADNIAKRIRELVSRNPGKTLFFPKGIYKVNSVNLTDPIEIMGEEGTTFQPSEVMTTMFYVTSDLVKISKIKLDGKQESRIGITIENEVSDIKLEHIDIANMFSPSRIGAYGVYIKANTSDIEINSCNINGISGKENGIVGDAMGANRGLYSYPCNNLKIINSTFNDIRGYEDGDAIHIQSFHEKKTLVVNKTLIEGCTFSNIYKRAIKIQADNVDIVNNKISNTEGESAILTGISLFGQNMNIVNNEVDLNWAVSGIEVGEGGNIVIKGNNVNIDSLNTHTTARKSKMQVGIYLHGRNLRLEGNRIAAPGHAIVSYKGVKDCEILDNSVNSKHRYKVYLNKSDAVNITTLKNQRSISKALGYLVKNSQGVVVNGKDY